MKFYLQPFANRDAAFCAMTHGEIAREPTRDAVPIGSVEWTRMYAANFGVTLPEPDTYPEALRPFLLRKVRRGLFADAAPGEFVKPIRCKAFTGALRRDIAEPVDPSEPVWISEPVTFTAEWRVYVCDGEDVGWAQYGDGDDAEPDFGAVQAMIEVWHDAPAGWALDIGRLADGRMALVEVNDGWALGYYKPCDRRAYLNTIAARWAELTARESP